MLGFVYGLAAMGLTLIFGVMRVINLSHGPVIALGMFVVYVLFTGAGVNPYLGLIAAAGLGFFFGFGFSSFGAAGSFTGPGPTPLLAPTPWTLWLLAAATRLFRRPRRAVAIAPA